jgi:hypothetical protein
MQIPALILYRRRVFHAARMPIPLLFWRGEYHRFIGDTLR